MGRNRRQQRLRDRRGQQRGQPQATTGTGRPARPGWRRTVDAWGGFPVLGVGLVVVVAVVALIWVSRPVAPSEDPLMGEFVRSSSTAHVNDPALFDVEPGLPPAGGPHFTQPLRAGIYDEQQQEGFIIHSLEHGMVWFSYNPDLISPADLEVVQSVAREFLRDVVVSPRPENNAPLFAVSWERRLRVDTPVDPDLLREFIRTNRDRAPEPGVR